MKHIALILSAFLAISPLSGAEQPALRKLVIDAGHGGKDPGAVSKDSETYEKTLALDIASRFAELVRKGCPDVEVILTRKTDVFVPLSTRADLANKAQADLFISIHVNAARNTSANGWSVHVMGNSAKSDLMALNMEICRRENDVVLLESDYTTSYMGFDPKDDQSYILMSLMQSAYLEQSLALARKISDSLASTDLTRNNGVSQNPFLVLWRTAMPSVLVELGFITNSGDLSVLRSATSRQKMAQALYKAFCAYKKEYDDSVRVDKP